MNIREQFKNKKRIVVKVGSSSLTHKETGRLDFNKMEVLVRELADLRNQGKDVILVSSGAIAVGKALVGMKERPSKVPEKQACAAIGQCRLMMIYQKLFAEYNHIAAQVLMTKKTVTDPLSHYNARNTFCELMKLGTVPIVNENDTVSTYEIQFGDNDTLSAIVANIAAADLLILLSDIDGLFTDDPNVNPDAEFIDVVEKLDDNLMDMGKGSSGSNVGTGGMATKLHAAKIATATGADMVIANGEDFHILHDIITGKQVGTVFKANKNENYNILDDLGE